MLLDLVVPTGSVRLTLFRDNQIIQEFVNHNLVVDSGLALITSRLEGVADNVVSHMAIGNGTTAPVGTNIDLESMLGSRVVLDGTNRVTTTTPNDTIQYTCTFEQGISSGVITEAGIFNAISGGTMMARVIFSAINKGALDTLVITWQLRFAGI